MASMLGRAVLIAEDDAAVRQSLERTLRLEGLDVTEARTGAEALERCAELPADLVILDVMMPEMDGLTACRILRSQSAELPILMLTARHEVGDRVAGLEAGADDYLLKPYASAELLARVRALLRRGGLSGSKDQLEYADLRLDPSARLAWRGDRAIELTKTEFDLLELLTFNAEVVLARDVIYERIWGYDFETSSRSLDVYIGYLRSKLEAESEPRLVQTVRGVGFVVRRPWQPPHPDRPDPRGRRLRRQRLRRRGRLPEHDRPAPHERRRHVDRPRRGRHRPDGDRHGRGGPGDGPDGGPDGFSECPSAGSFAPATAAQIVSDDGAVAACIEGSPTLPVTDADRSLSDGEARLRTVDLDGERYRVLSTPWPAGGTLQIARSLAESADVLEQLRLQLVGLVVLATVVAAGLGWAVATRLVRPVVRLRDEAHRIATTLDLTTPIDVSGPGEVGSLALSFSTMVGAVRRSQDQQRRLVADASHEMRTPLTSLRSNVELMRQIERLPAPEREEVVGDVLDDVDELSTLLGELVDLASDLATAEPVEPVSLGDLARTAAARTERRTGRVVTVSDGDGSERPGRPRQLERAIGNLVDNAVKYSADGPIEVVVEGGRVTVRDRGRGIPSADLDRVFDRFHRAVDVRTEPGSGLGLSIVDEIVRSHGGSVFARNRDGGGAEVGFSLPDA